MKAFWEVHCAASTMAQNPGHHVMTKMTSHLPNFRASVIVSVYRDVEKLRCVLAALDRQSVQDFEILISEDGESPEMAGFLAHVAHPRLMHLTQADQGFRKNRALNRAIRAARSDYLIFIDGDCVPHRCFVENHLNQAEAGAVCSGRRIELGPAISQALMANPAFYLEQFESPWRYLRFFNADIKNFEYGFLSHRLQHWFGRKPLALVGSNFSCHRSTLEAVNGFDEDYQSPGIGEDADIDWRFQAAGFRLKNIKFLVPLYHLWHPRGYTVSDENIQRLAQRQRSGDFVCTRGLNQADKP